VIIIAFWAIVIGLFWLAVVLPIKTAGKRKRRRQYYEDTYNAQYYATYYANYYSNYYADWYASLIEDYRRECQEYVTKALSLATGETD